MQTATTTQKKKSAANTVAPGERGAVAKVRRPKRPYPLKLSGMTIDLGENTNSWEQQCLDALAAQHPWTAKVNVSVSMTATSGSGFGAGFFHLTPKNVPASATGGDRLNVVTIPIIIRSYRLLPLDVFFFKKAFYPLTEERAIRILRLPDLFTDPDRTLSEIERDSIEMMGIRSMGYNSRMNGALKSAGADPDMLLKRALQVALTSKTVKVSSPKNTPLDGNTEILKALCPDGYRREFCRDTLLRMMPREKVSGALANTKRYRAIVGAVEVRKTSSCIETRTWWLSHEDDGKPRVDAWVPTQLSKVSAALGETFAERVLEKGWGYRQLATTHAVADTQALKESKLQTKLSEAGMIKLSEMSATQSGWFQFLNAGEDRDLEPRIAVLPTTFKGLLVYGADPSGPDSQGGASWVAYEAEGGKMIVEKLEWSLERKLRVIPLSPVRQEELANLTWERAPRALRGIGDSGWNSALAMWWDDGVLRANGVLPSVVTKDPLFGNLMSAAEEVGALRASWQRSSCTHATVDDSGSVKKAYTISTPEPDTRRILVLPGDALLVHYGGDVKMGQHVDRRAEEDNGLEDLLAHVSGNKVSSPSEELTVNFDDGGYVLRAPRWVYGLLKASGPLENLGERDVLVTLSGVGVPVKSAKKVVMSAKQTGTGRAYIVRPGQDVEGFYEEAEKLSSSWRAMIEEASRERAPIVEGLSRLHYFFKHSAPNDALNALLNTTVDSALSLGFLGVDTISKFADMRPQFDETLSKLCALLVAVRMGLTEIPEDALELTIRSLDQVLKGLRGLDAAVEVGLS